MIAEQAVELAVTSLPGVALALARSVWLDEVPQGLPGNPCRARHRTSKSSKNGQRLCHYRECPDDPSRADPPIVVVRRVIDRR